MKTKPTTESKSLQIPKTLINTFKVLHVISKKAAGKLAVKHFFSPIKYPTPEREMLYKHSLPLHREIVADKRITTYVNGEQPYRVLLVHGWSGRASQFFELGPALSKAEISYVSFTAPAHGSSNDKKTDVVEFIDSIEFIIHKYGPFEALIGHSLGGVAAINVASSNKAIKKVVTIGTPATISGSIDHFCEVLQLSDYVNRYIKDYIKTHYNESFEEQSVSHLVKSLAVQGLIIHDLQDMDVASQDAQLIHDNWKESKLMMTDGLGHRRILSDSNVINKIVDFLK